MNTKFNLINFVSKALSSRHKQGDGLTLPDEIIKQAIKGNRELNKDEKKVLIDSPITLQRVRNLAKQVQSKQQLSDHYFIYRAADCGKEEFSIDSNQGNSTLHVTTGRNGYIIVLKLATDFLHKLQQSGQQLGLKVGNITLPYKQPDPWGEVSWEWYEQYSPKFNFEQVGKISLKIN